MKSEVVKKIVTYVCNYFGMDEALVYARNRNRHVSTVRQICYYFARKYTNKRYMQKIGLWAKYMDFITETNSLQEISFAISGNRYDHAMVVTASENISTRMETDITLLEHIENLEKNIELITLDSQMKTDLKAKTEIFIKLIDDTIPYEMMRTTLKAPLHNAVNEINIKNEQEVNKSVNSLFEEFLKMFVNESSKEKLRKQFYTTYHEKI